MMAFQVYHHEYSAPLLLKLSDSLLLVVSSKFRAIFFFLLAVPAKTTRRGGGMRNAPEGWIALLLCRAWVLEQTWGGNGVPGGTFYTCLPVEKKSIL